MDITRTHQGPAVSATLDPSAFREVMGHYPTGVAVVTGFDGDQPVGMVVGTFSSVSMDPPLVAFMPQVGSGTYARLQKSEAYCINVLAHDQLTLCRSMAVPRDDKFDDVDWSGGALTRGLAEPVERTGTPPYVPPMPDRMVHAAQSSSGQAILLPRRAPRDVPVPGNSW